MEPSHRDRNSDLPEVVPAISSFEFGRAYPEGMKSSRALVVAMLVAVAVLGGTAEASGSSGVVLAQEGDDTGGGNPLEERSEKEAEADEAGGGIDDSDTNKEVADDPAAEEATEAGPPWTYQMARISLVVLVLMGLAVAGAYYRFVVQRQRGIL